MSDSTSASTSDFAPAFTPAFTMEELTIPATLADTGGVEFSEMVTVRNAVLAGIYNGDDLEYTAEELLPHWNDQYEPKRGLLARVDGRAVARAIYDYNTEGSAHTAYFAIEVLPEFRGRGIGTALLAELDAFAAADSRTTHQVYAISQELPGQRLTAPTGFGSVPLADDGVRFLLRHGFQLEQVERASKLTLPVEPSTMAALMTAAVAASALEYRLHTFVDRTPPEWLQDMAMLQTRMSTDAPSAGMEEVEDVWTVQRMLDWENRNAEGPRSELVAMVEHISSGRLAGFTSLSVPPELHRTVTQEDTIVLKEHRGHRLGMLMKLANIEHLERVAPGHPSITTSNAEENRPMLSVNEAVGFVAVGYEGAWKRVVAG